MSEIQPSLGELEDAQNTAYENFFTARDAVTAAGERVAAADEAVCLAEKKYLNSEISVEEWEATLQELSDAQVAETAANENYEAAAAGAQAAAEAVEAKKQELRDSRVNDTAYVVHCARIECPFGMRESYLALDATHGVYSHFSASSAGVRCCSSLRNNSFAGSGSRFTRRPPRNGSIMMTGSPFLFA